jgi:serine/threonine protein kinase/Tol biopolymer transport system component
LIGSTISHYQILERLGGGGMGVVYKAKDLRLDRWVALKFLLVERGASDEDRRRFLREAKASSALDHPNICGVYDIGESDDGRLYLAMAYVPGETLKSRIAHGTLTSAEAVDIAAQIADGLAEAHSKKITHRDIKPANVIVGDGGRIKIVDFGLAGLADQTRLTRPGIAIGTASYMSPEQCRGEAADPSTDLWALGVVLYEMLSGRLPFPGERPEAVIRAILQRPPDPLRGLEPELERIVLRALEKDPADRYPNAEAMRADLEGFRQSHDPRWRPTLTEISLSPLWNPPASSGSAAARESPERSTGAGLVGSTVSHYRIGQPIGGGGMGIVYRAEDLRLERTVALKFLPPELSFDPETKERFLKEARSASALDHPNVCTIHEVGETEDGRLFLSMPCYQGETLRQRIARGPLPLEEALDYARQVARGLDKAHRHGIVHRDIKPANLLITDDGVVKILDFGLAKLAGTAALTRVGSSIGTPAYMSPEQARGDEVDPRTDLWSLGVILYEMLTGRKPFRGEHEQAVLYALLNEPPEPISRLLPEVPAGLGELVGRLLAKDPALRYGSALEVLNELKVLSGITLGATGMQTAAVAIGPGPVPGVQRPARRWPWLAAAAAVFLLGLVAWRLFGRGEAPPPRASYQQLTDQEGRALFPSLSPDGNYFLYTREAGGDLDIFWQRSTGGGKPTNLTSDSPSDDSQPAFSPDGSQIAFRSERDGGGIFVMGATGESPRRVTNFGFNPAWSPDGKNLVVATERISDPTARYSWSELYRVPSNGGEKRRISRGDAVQPSWSPHGRRIAYWGLSSGSSQRTLYTLPAEGGTPVPVLADPYFSWNPLWSPDGRYLYFVSDRGGSMNLWRVAIDESSGKREGEPQPITQPAPSIGFLSISGDGRRIVFAMDDSHAFLERAAFDPATLKVAPDLSTVVRTTRGVRSAEASPDGRLIAFHTEVPQEDLFLYDLSDESQRQLTDDAARDRHPHWSPDGSELVFYSDRGKVYEIWTIRADGGGLARVAPAVGGVGNTFPLFSPDGRFLTWTEVSGRPMLFDRTLPPSERKPRPLPLAAPTSDSFAPSSWSADGGWLAGELFPAGRPSGGPGIYSFATRTYTQLAEHGKLPIWMRDGRHLLFLDEGKLFAVDRFTREIRLLKEPPASSSFGSVSLDPANRTLYLVRNTEEGGIGMLKLEQ